MPEIKITLEVRVSFREKAHREAIVETTRQGAQQVLTSIAMLTPSNNRIQPQVIMKVTERGEEDREIDIARDMAQANADIEDPFATSP